MINNSFDKEIAKNLKNYKVDYDHSSWNRLENKLNESEGDDAIFDSVIAGKLKAYAPVSSGESFARLENKLNKGEKRVLFFWYKELIGVAAMLLLIALTFMYFNIDKKDPIVKNNLDTYNKESLKSKIGLNNVGKPKSDLIKSGNDKGDVITNIKEITLSNKVTSNGILNKETIRLKNDFIPVPNHKVYKNNGNFGLSYLVSKRSNKFDFRNSIGRNSGNSNVLNSSLLNDKFNIILNVDIYPILAEVNNEKSNSNGEFIESHKQVVKSDKVINDLNNKSNLDKNRDIVLNGEEGKVDSVRVFNAMSSTREVFAKVSISPGVNIISTPNDLLLGTTGYQQMNFGAGAGVSFSYKNGRNELELGVDYKRINCEPRKTVVSSNSFTYFLNNIKYDKIVVPLTYRYHFIENKKWDLYVLSGASAGFVANTNIEFIKEENNKGGLPVLARELQDDFDFINSVYGQKEYKKGVFEGGVVKENMHFALTGGFGLKRSLKNGISLYFEPQYSYSFGTYGPNEDKLNSIDFKLGISKSFNL